MSDLTIKDYKNRTREKLEHLLDSESEKEMYEKGYKTERLEPFSALLLWMDKEFYDKI